MAADLSTMTRANVAPDDVFTWDAPVTLPAYISDTRWNGWECPVFTVADIRAHRATLHRMFDTPDHREVGMFFDWDADADLPTFIDAEGETFIDRFTAVDGTECLTIGYACFTWLDAD